MKPTVCEKNMCCGCYACHDICPENAITVVDNKQSFNSYIDIEKCINCDLCHKVCPSNNAAKLVHPKKWYQGWINNAQAREKSTSGGIARALCEKFIEDGGAVCSCAFEDGKFGFRLVDSKDALSGFQGSKYVKSCPEGIYKKIKAVINGGVSVLFIGLPCQCEAVRNYVGSSKQERLYTVDLICHGTPSVKLFEQFLNEHGAELHNIERFAFRSKTGFGEKTETKLEKPGVMDRYMIGFLESVFYTENCYNCKFATKMRASDITIGDSWGSTLSVELGKGLSLIMCQSEKGISLVESLDVTLHDVDFENAVANNPQLSHPCKRPAYLDDLFKDINRGASVDSVVFKYAFKKSFRQLIKKLLICVGVLRVKGGYMLSYVTRKDNDK